jgi:putative hydrolase of the HAD superfamily
MIEAVRRCRDTGLVTGLITNNVASMSRPGDGDRWDSALGFELPDLFDVVIESSLEGVRKPDPRAYDLACERMDVGPDEVVFLDDLGINLKPAKAMGMTTIKVVDPDVALAELGEVLGITL